MFPIFSISFPHDLFPSDPHGFGSHFFPWLPRLLSVAIFPQAAAEQLRAADTDAAALHAIAGPGATRVTTGVGKGGQ